MSASLSRKQVTEPMKMFIQYTMTKSEKYKILLKFGLEQRELTIVHSKTSSDNPCNALSEDAYNMISDVYGKDLDFNLMENVRYFVCSGNKKHPSMKMLSSYKDLRYDENTVEIVVWSAKKRKHKRSMTVCGHHLITRSTRNIKVCQHCNYVIWGIGKHAYCTKCAIHVHRKCALEMTIPCRNGEATGIEHHKQQASFITQQSSSSLSLSSQNPSVKQHNREEHSTPTSSICSPDRSRIAHHTLTWPLGSPTTVDRAFSCPILDVLHFEKKIMNCIHKKGINDCKDGSCDGISEIMTSEVRLRDRSIKDMQFRKGIWSGIFTQVEERENVRYQFAYQPKSKVLVLHTGDDKHLQISLHGRGQNAAADSAVLIGRSYLGVKKKQELQTAVDTIASGLSKMESFGNSEDIDSIRISTNDYENGLSFNDLYEVRKDRVLGAGRFAEVFDGIKKGVNKAVAIKKMKMTKNTPPMELVLIEREAKLLFALNYPGVLKCEGLYRTEDSIILVTEKLDTDMLEFILQSKAPKSKLTEPKAKYLCFQIACALDYLHSNHIAHCDLKPENVLLYLLSSEHQQVKLGDFGFAKVIKDESVRHTLVGTPAYLPPEVFNQELRKSKGYDHSMDMWSFGVIVYVCLCGYFPYRDDQDLLEQINRHAGIFVHPVWDTVSKQAKFLIAKQLLVASTTRRLTSRGVMSSEWFAKDRILLQQIYELEAMVGRCYLSQYLTGN